MDNKYTILVRSIALWMLIFWVRLDLTMAYLIKEY